MTWKARTSFAVPTWYTASSMTQGHVKEILLLAVDRFEGLLGPAQRKLVGCESSHRQLLEKLTSSRPAAGDRPARRQPGGNGRDLRAPQRASTAVECIAQGKTDLLGPVPGAHQGRALVRQQRQRLSQRGGLSAELDQQRDASSASARIDHLTQLLRCHSPYPEGF